MASDNGALLDEILSYQAKTSGCSLPGLIASLSEAEQDAVNTALNDPMIRATAIWKFLKSRDIEVGERTVQRHRSGSCGCARG